MRAPTSAGQVLVDTLAEGLVAQIADRYTDGRPASFSPSKQHVIDERRLWRVLDYMNAHLEAEIGLEELADVACLSQFHFIRMFSQKWECRRIVILDCCGLNAPRPCLQWDVKGLRRYRSSAAFHLSQTSHPHFAAQRE